MMKDECLLVDMVGRAIGSFGFVAGVNCGGLTRVLRVVMRKRSVPCSPHTA